MRPITPTSLLDSICWSISEPTSTAAIYTDSLSSEGASEQRTPQFFDAKGDAKDSEASFANLTRPLTERFFISLPFSTQLKPNSGGSLSSRSATSQDIYIFVYLFAVRNLKWYSGTIFLPYYFLLTDFLRWGHLQERFSVMPALRASRC